MSTNGSQFEWRHALGCAVIIVATAAAMVLVCGKAHAGTVVQAWGGTTGMTTKADTSAMASGSIYLDDAAYGAAR